MNFYHYVCDGGVHHILLITQEVINKFLRNLLRGEMSH